MSEDDGDRDSYPELDESVESALGAAKQAIDVARRLAQHDVETAHVLAKRNIAELRGLFVSMADDKRDDAIELIMSDEQGKKFLRLLLGQ